ncbi:MAG: hypothetical protein IJJ85_01405 [Clostridia bacterium]|nr:hypothetical protein [Clostridia bacterium]
MGTQLSKEELLILIKETAARLGRTPNKADLSPGEVERIKAFFGPWRRALEAAGLLPVKEKGRGCAPIGEASE